MSDNVVTVGSLSCVNRSSPDGSTHGGGITGPGVQVDWASGAANLADLAEALSERVRFLCRLSGGGMSETLALEHLDLAVSWLRSGGGG